MIMNPKIGVGKKKRNVILGIAIVIMFVILMPVLCLLINPGNNKDTAIKVDKNKIARQKFINTVAPYAEQSYKEYKIFASITLAQAMLESDTGKSALTKKANNLFGIKANKWTGKTITMKTKEHYGNSDVVVAAVFRSYDSWSESIEDHVNFLLKNSTYKQHGVFTAANYTEQAEAIQAAGYATDPNYANELITLIKKYKLDKYDSAK